MVVAADGREMMTRFPVDHPDLVLLDLMLPELSEVLTEAFRRHVLKLFVERELFEPEVADNMLDWLHSGFSVHDGVWLDQDDTLPTSVWHATARAAAWRRDDRRARGLLAR